MKTHKIGNENLENWLSNMLDPKIDFRTYEFDYEEGLHISMFIIPAAVNRPIDFQKTAYIRIGSITRKLSDFPEKESKIWRNSFGATFEKEIAKHNVNASEVIQLLSTQTYFELMKLPYPSDQIGVIEKFLSEGLIIKDGTNYNITRLGAILFAKDLSVFESVQRKSIRVIVYKGNNKIDTIRDQVGSKGYAVGFEGLVDWINGQLPANEEIGKALRLETRMYPEIAIRELVANALIHQDLSEKGFPMIEIYSDRIEISNPGNPLIKPERFIDEYVSRNERLADLMRRMGFCEEKGSGLDKVIFNNELFQLPPIKVTIGSSRTFVTMYSYKPLNDMDKEERIRACYQHACLKYVSNEKMTNQTLRERFKIDNRNAATVSRIIREALDEKVIKDVDPMNKSRKYACYIPFWA
ncbi:Transcriptional Regulator [Bacteroidales bacterium CF]|nr:Transcriptional Regulator [Bacteroidales bacterium CF]